MNFAIGVGIMLAGIWIAGALVFPVSAIGGKVILVFASILSIVFFIGGVSEH